MNKGSLRNTLGPLVLILACPPAVMIFWYTNTVLKGSFLAFWQKGIAEGFFTLVSEIWRPYFFGTQTAWMILAVFSSIQLLFMRVLPGKVFRGPPSPKGNIPIYKANGMSAYLLTLGLFLLSTSLGLFKATVLYDNLGGLLGGLNFFSLLYCLFLYLKGRFAPSSSDYEFSGNFIFDYYWGSELYPRLFGWDLKMFTNCRFGMMGWGLLLLSYAAKQKELYDVISDSMVVALTLQFIYLTKFFFWETGYLRSLDIMHDHAGFYICWGCLVWVPCIYTSPTLFLVHHPIQLGLPLSAIVLMVGGSAILINYWADKQRYAFRSTDGRCRIWGKQAQLTVVHYTTTEGNVQENLLLASGWWGVARHFHYIPEIIGALCWSLPALFSNFLPYFYVCFLTVLLLDRAHRDEMRCAKKYGEGWIRHCQKVPFK